MGVVINRTVFVIFRKVVSVSAAGVGFLIGIPFGSGCENNIYAFLHPRSAPEWDYWPMGPLWTLVFVYLGTYSCVVVALTSVHLCFLRIEERLTLSQNAKSARQD